MKRLLIILFVALVAIATPIARRNEAAGVTFTKQQTDQPNHSHREAKYARVQPNLVQACNVRRTDRDQQLYQPNTQRESDRAAHD